jgi:hemin uptake protein HemP
VNAHSSFDGHAVARRGDTSSTSTPMRVISSQVLFNGAKEICIEHQGSIYRLKITRQGKLILNK